MCRRLICLSFLSCLIHCGMSPTADGHVTQDKIAFISATPAVETCDVFVMNADGTEKTQLTHGLNDRATHLYCSPDGAKIAVAARRRGGGADLYIMNSDGTDLAKIGDRLLYVSFLAWSPDCLKLAFSTKIDGNGEIYTMNIDGSELTRLTFNDIYDDMSPRWSPDGSKIVFTSGEDAGIIGAVYIMNSDGSGKKLLADHIDHCGGPKWSPDGSRIAYQMGGVLCESDIFVISPDGSGQVNLTHNGYHDFSHSWSPDGTKIVFMSVREGNRDIYIINANGTGERMLTDRKVNYNHPSWSPDGSMIAFVDWYDRAGLGYSSEDIYIINSDGTGMKNLTNNSAFNCRPSWLKSK